MSGLIIDCGYASIWCDIEWNLPDSAKVEIAMKTHYENGPESEVRATISPEAAERLAMHLSSYAESIRKRITPPHPDTPSEESPQGKREDSDSSF